MLMAGMFESSNGQANDDKRRHFLSLSNAAW